MNMLAAFCLSTLAAAAASTFTDLDDPNEPWRHEAVGVTTDVPSPFEPLSVDGSQVSCWGRTYTLATPLPAQITSHGQELLAAPMRIIAERGDEQIVLAADAVNISLARQDRIELSGEQALGRLTVTTAGWLEYDGAMQVTLTIAGQGSLDRLSVEIPYRPESATFFHVSSQWGKYVYERIGTDVGWTWSSNWQALTWVGDHYRGLTFVTERYANWTGPADQALQLERRDGVVVFRANMINETTAIEGERAYTLGLQATPGKPLPTGWHGRHVGQGNASATSETAQARRALGQTVALIWNSDTKWFSYPQAKDPEALVRAVRAYHDAGMQVVVYITLSGTGPESKVERRHHDEWLMGQGDKPLFASAGVEGRTHGLTSTCPASSYADWLVWAVDRAMEDYDLDGVYIDNAGPYYCSNELHGCGGPGGRRYPYFATRELHKRLWSVIHGRKPEKGLMWEHNSRTSNSFNLTFVDIYSDGEHFRVKSKGRPEEITRTLLDITATGRQWGAQPCFLPSALNLREEYTDWLLTRTLPFGNVLLSVPTWMDYSRLSPVLQARLAFGLSEALVEWYTPEAVPEWLPVGPEELLVGAYLRPDNRVMLTLGNPTDDKAVARMDLRKTQAKLGGPVTVTDALTGAECPPIGANMVLAIPADSFRVVLIQPRPEE